MGNPQIRPHYWYSNKSLSHTIHLPTNHIPIILTTLQQLLVCSLNRYHTIVDHVDDITVHNRAQTIRHCHHRAPLILHALNAVKNVSWFSLSNALVASSRRRIAQNRSCQRQTLCSDLLTQPFPQNLIAYPVFLSIISESSHSIPSSISYSILPCIQSHWIVVDVLRRNHHISWSFLLMIHRFIHRTILWFLNTEIFNLLICSFLSHQYHIPHCATIWQGRFCKVCFHYTWMHFICCFHFSLYASFGAWSYFVPKRS